MSATVPPDREPDAQPASAAAPTVAAPAGNVKELRLGLVCYGGVSLAIYMHGMTKEIHRAIRASVLEERGLPSDDGAASERAYRELLAAVRDEQDVHTRIVVDAIAGSSAGGINGIFLAKALAHDQSQDALRDLWFEHGDLERIIRQPDWLPDLAVNVLERVIPDGGDVPSRDARVKLALAATGLHSRSLLDGDVMSNRIYDALAGMEAEPHEPSSLMPPRHELELSVTVTDHWGYVRRLPISDPPIVAEGQHRHLLRFGYRSDQEDDFTPRENGALALAARATSSLPAGFAPVHAGGFAEVLPDGATQWPDIQRFFRAYELAQAEPALAQLVDGGVLDNRPFAPVIRAIRQRPAANEVDRYLLYLEPDPNPPGAQRDKAPRPVPALLGALSGLPRSEPILDELADLLTMNERVRAVRDAIEANWASVETIVTETLGNLEEPPSSPDDPRLAEWSKRMHDRAAELGPLTYASYLRLKISSAVDAFASAACLVCDYTDASNQAFLVRRLVRGWARRRGLFEHSGSPTPEQEDFVRAFDLGFAERRLRFVIAGVSWLYRDLGSPDVPERHDLDRAKERLYEAVAAIEWVASGRGYADEMLGAVRTCFGEERLNEYLARESFDVEDVLDEHGGDLDTARDRLGEYLSGELQGFGGRLYLDLLQLTDGWPAKARRDLLVRYLGFAVWDSTLFPLQALSEVAERDQVRVARFSPGDSRLLKPVHEEAARLGKVLGAGLGHAYAFFSRRARENDYLWGRLDAAERLVGLLLTTTESVDGREKRVPGRDRPEYREWCKRVFRAVLKEDEPHLPTIAEDVGKLKRQVEGL